VNLLQPARLQRAGRLVLAGTRRTRRGARWMRTGSKEAAGDAAVVFPGL